MIKVLFICANPPWPPDSGAPLRSLGCIRTVSQIAKVGLVSMTSGRIEERDTARLETYCDIVHQVPSVRTQGNKLADLLLAIRSGNPYIIQSTQSPQMLKAVAKIIDRWQPDVVQAEWFGASPYLEVARQKNIPTIYAAHNIEHHVAATSLKPWHQKLRPFSTEAIRACEISIAKKADVIITVTQNEKKWFNQLNKRVICIPNSVHPDDYSFCLPSKRPKNTMAFVGHLHYPPNIEASKRVIQSIFPEVLNSIPDANCIIAGRQPTRELVQLAANNSAIHIFGDIEDIRTIWDRATILVSPLYSGGGSRLKLLEAAACGLPIVTSLFGAKGLALDVEQDFIAASTNSEFANASSKILKEPHRFDTLARSARDAVMHNHNWNIMTDKLLEVYENIAYHYR